MIPLANPSFDGNELSYDGKPCKYGHGTKRYHSSRGCIECTRLRGIADTPEKKAALRARSAAYRARHPERVKQAGIESRRRNPPDYKKYEARRKPRPIGFAAHYAAKRRAQKKCATPPWFEKLAVKRLYRDCGRLNKVYAPYGLRLEVDHIIPLCSPMVCGLHALSNLQIILTQQNQKKGNRFDTASEPYLLW